MISHAVGSRKNRTLRYQSVRLIIFIGYIQNYLLFLGQTFYTQNEIEILAF